MSIARDPEPKTEPDAVESTTEEAIGPVESVSIADLRHGHSVRVRDVHADYVRQLAEDHDELPPIVVDRATMRVIDGRHRLLAKLRMGARTIAARMFDGTSSESYLLAVRLNLDSGLPLSPAERSAAAEQILCLWPQWSDRAVAAATGLASGTIATVRARSGAADTNVRIGRDGRVRPVSGVEGRLAAGRFVALHPDASLRTIATAAGISVSTARDVRERLRRGQDPVPPRLRSGRPDRAMPALAVPENQRPHALAVLRKDPSLRGALIGRMLLRLLDSHSAVFTDWRRLADRVPPHCASLLSDAARQCAATWLRFAERLDQQHRPNGEPS